MTVLYPGDWNSTLEGNLPTIYVRAGDFVAVVVDVSATDVAHGFLMASLSYDGDGNPLVPVETSQDQVLRFFSVYNWVDDNTYSLDFATEPRFFDFYGHYPFGVARGMWSSDVGGGTIFAGIVNDIKIGTRLHFTDYVFGPYAMNGVFEVTW
eukprot:TRINITY_DN12313_c0_g1_i1.p1 TRINITY_DN12313_c0_g1~~TRINITY_DN12313_c0_g1_i1.p1  ORF type:complete len:152 (-),score=35.57 TRINITY_DN12313_c0_g1_i1:103-558(-)